MDTEAIDQDDDGRASPPGAKAAAAAAPDGAAAAKPARAPRKKDPKLDLDLLEADGGFNDIWHKMAPAFKASFQGEGHEVADLRRLLELYQRWQTRFYPHCDFDTFVTKLEKAGRSRVVKAKMGSMRQNLLGLIFPTEGEEPEAAAGGPPTATAEGAPQAPRGPAAMAGRAAAAAAGAAAAGGGGAADVDLPLEPLDEDDELVAMQREAEWEAAYAAIDELEAAPPPPPAAPTAAADMELEELMNLAEELHYAAPAAAAATAAMAAAAGGRDAAVPAVGSGGGGGGGSSETGEGPGAAAAGVAAAKPSSPSADVDPDEELIALAYDMPHGGVNQAKGVAVAGQAPMQEGLGGEEEFDDELRMLAGMETTAAEAVVAASLRAGGDGAGRRTPAAQGPDGGDGTAMDVDGEGGAAAQMEAAAQSIRQYGGTAEFDADLLAMPVYGCTQVPSGRSGVGDDVAASYGGSRGGEVYGSNAEPAAASPPPEPLAAGRTADGGGEGLASAAGAGGGGTFLDSEPQGSQGTGAGMALRDLLMTQTQE